MLFRSIQSVTEEMTRSLEERLKATEYFDVVPSQEVQQALESLSLRPATTPLTSDQVKTLGKTLHVQAVMITTLSGYGRIKPRWQAYLIGSGVVEGITEGVITARVVHNTWVAVGVGVQEILQEVLTWGGGVFLFDKFFTPVILESEVVSTIDGKPIWQKTAFARINRQGLKAFPKEERGKKELRLRVTAEKAEDELVKSLQKALIKNIPRT